MFLKNWREWKAWQYVGMAAFGILLAFLYFTNRSSFNSMKDEMKDKFNKKEDDLEQQQKDDVLKVVVENKSSLLEAEDKIHKTQTTYEDKMKEDRSDEKTVDEKISSFNDFMDTK